MKTPRSKEKSRAIANNIDELLMDLDHQTLHQYFAWVEGDRYNFNVRQREVPALPLAARSAIPERGYDPSLEPPDGHILCESLELRKADGALVPIAILTDAARHDVFLWLTMTKGNADGARIAAPRTLVHMDEHYPLHPLVHQERLFQVMGLSLDEFRYWDGHDAYLETDLSDLEPQP